MKITVTYSTIDNFRQSRTFKTLDGARRFAHKWIGETADVGGGYAVSFDGVGKITVSGDATIAQLFASAHELDALEEANRADAAAERAEWDAHFAATTFAVWIGSPCYDGHDCIIGQSWQQIAAAVDRARADALFYEYNEMSGDHDVRVVPVGKSYDYRAPGVPVVSDDLPF